MEFYFDRRIIFIIKMKTVCNTSSYLEVAGECSTARYPGWPQCSQGAGRGPAELNKVGKAGFTDNDLHKPSWVRSRGHPGSPGRSSGRQGGTQGYSRSPRSIQDQSQGWAVARLVLRLKDQGSWAKGYSPGVGAHELCLGPWQLQLSSSILAPKSWEYHTILPFI